MLHDDARRLRKSGRTHEAVKDTVAEDLMMAQRAHEAGLRVSLVIGTHQLSTRMYDGLGSIVQRMDEEYLCRRTHGDAGRNCVGRLLFPFALVGGPTHDYSSRHWSRWRLSGSSFGGSVRAPNVLILVVRHFGHRLAVVLCGHQRLRAYPTGGGWYLYHWGC